MPPSPGPTPPLLGVLPFLALLGGTLWATEWAVALGYHPPERLRERAWQAVASMEEGRKNLVITGTCLSEQQIRGDVVQRVLGDGWKVHNLGGRASGPADWYLLLKNRLPAEKLDGIAVAWVRGDLSTHVPTWESQVLDLATFADLPLLTETSCEGDAGCALDLGLGKVSAAYRYRGLLANMFWTKAGAHWVPPADPGTRRAADPLQSGMEARTVDGPQTGSRENAEVAERYLELLLDWGRDRGVPVWLVRMPERHDAPDSQDPVPASEVQMVRLRQLAADHGASWLQLDPVTQDRYVDERHLNTTGVYEMSRTMGETMAAELGVKPRPEGYTPTPWRQPTSTAAPMPSARGPVAPAAALPPPSPPPRPAAP